MIIVFFVTTLDSGGLENYLLRFLNYKASYFNRIIVFCKSGKGGQLQDKYLSIPNVEIHLKKISFFNVKDYFYIYNFFANNNINSVCDFTGNFAGLILFCAKKAKIRKRVAFYRGSDNHFKETLFRLLYNQFVKQLTLRYATNILSNSKAAFNFFHPVKWKVDSKFEVIYNGINPEPFINEQQNLRQEFKIPKDAFVIGHTGRYNKAKNHETIMKVAIELCRNHDEIFFLMCGNGVKDNLQVVVKKENLTDKILLSNNRIDIPKFLKTLNCFYFPSISEGQPNSLIEAMVSDLPIVASNIEPIKESIPHYYINELIPPTSVELAMDKIMKVFLNQKKAKLQSWAIEKYNYTTLFNRFYDVLHTNES